jgi:hypothetical protein
MSILQYIVDALSYVLSFVLALLPDCPFQKLSNYVVSNETLGMINSMLMVLQYWLLAIAVFYGIQAIGRIVKLFGE